MKRFARVAAMLVLSVACRKPPPPPPAAPPHEAAPRDVALADTLDSIEGFRGGVLAATMSAQHPELRTYGQQMTEAHFARNAAIMAWRKKHFPNVPPAGPLKMPCGEDVLFGKSLPMNPNDVQVIDAILLQSQCEVLFASSVLRESNDRELVAIAREVIGSSGPEVSALLRMKRQWSSGS
jgi:hypothetical protein